MVFWFNALHDYKRAEKILRQALAQPTPDDPYLVQKKLMGFAKRQDKNRRSRLNSRQEDKNKFRRSRKRGKK